MSRKAHSMIGIEYHSSIDKDFDAELSAGASIADSQGQHGRHWVLRQKGQPINAELSAGAYIVVS